MWCILKKITLIYHFAEITCKHNQFLIMFALKLAVNEKSYSKRMD